MYFPSAFVGRLVRVVDTHHGACMHSLDDTRARCIIPLPDPVSRLYTICGASVAYYNVTCPYYVPIPSASVR